LKLESSFKIAAVFQFIVIVLMSVSASYTFLNTQTNVLINGICFYRYLSYGMTVVFSYVCVSRYNKHIALLLSFALAILALSPLSKEIIEAFPTFVSFFAILMGITTVLLVPEARGRGFFAFIVALILPSILVESKVGGFPYFIATSQSITYYEVFATTMVAIGGYFYLKCTTLGNLARHDFLSKGGKENETNAINQWISFTSGIIVVCTIGAVAFLAIIAPVVASAFQPLLKDQPLYAFALMGCIGILVVGAIFASQILTREID